MRRRCNPGFAKVSGVNFLAVTLPLWNGAYQVKQRFGSAVNNVVEVAAVANILPLQIVINSPAQEMLAADNALALARETVFLHLTQIEALD
jgi:hypothetical protein